MHTQCIYSVLKSVNSVGKCLASKDEIDFRNGEIKWYSSFILHLALQFSNTYLFVCQFCISFESNSVHVFEVRDFGEFGWTLTLLW